MFAGISWEASREPLGGSFEASWMRFWGLLGPVLGLLGAPWGLLGLRERQGRSPYAALCWPGRSMEGSGAFLGPPWARLGGVLVVRGPYVGCAGVGEGFGGLLRVLWA